MTRNHTDLCKFRVSWAHWKRNRGLHLSMLEPYTTSSWRLHSAKCIYWSHRWIVEQYLGIKRIYFHLQTLGTEIGVINQIWKQNRYFSNEKRPKLTDNIFLPLSNCNFWQTWNSALNVSFSRNGLFETRQKHLASMFIHHQIQLIDILFYHIAMSGFGMKYVGFKSILCFMDLILGQMVTVGKGTSETGRSLWVNVIFTGFARHSCHISIVIAVQSHSATPNAIVHHNLN